MLSFLLYILSHYFIWIILSIIIYIYRHQLIRLINGFQSHRAYLRFLKEQTHNRYDSKARYELGLYHLRLGNYREAVHLYQEALETDPQNADLHFYLGVAFQKMRNYPPAIAAFKNCLNLKNDYGSGQALLKLGDIYRSQSNYSAALDVYSQVLLLNPYEGEAYYKMGLTKYHLKLYSEAKEYLNQAITEIKALPKFRYKKDRIWLYQSILLKLLLFWKS